MYQTTTNVDRSAQYMTSITTTTTTTTPTPINNSINQSYDGYQNLLSKPEPHQQHQQHQQQQQLILNNGFYQPPRQAEFYTNRMNIGQQTPGSNNENIFNYNQESEDNRDDTISLALDEIGAIINSQGFETDHQQVANGDEPVYCNLEEDNNNNNNNNNNDDDNDNNSFEETEASIYETLKNIISAEDELTTPDNSIPGTHHQATVTDNNMSNSNRRNNHMMINKSFNMFARPDDNGEAKQQPYVEIVEQPAKCALRFRYKCEGRSAGSLPGVSATADNKTFPSIRIVNYVGKAVVVVSCVTKEAPYRAHPHNIVGKEGCKKGICTIVLNNELDMIRSFSSLGIQCVKRKDIEESLALRESINVDPFRNGFVHKSCTSNIDLNVVRLCFQVFIEGSTPNKCDVPLVPVVSEPIHDKKAMSDLVITKLSHCSAPATGGREVILLCDRIAKDDIQVRFFEERDGNLIWETFTDLAPTDVHKQVAICFKTPKYFNENITQPVMARIQLRRISDNQVSEPRHFQFLPCESDEDIISRKRQKIEWVNMNHYALDNILQPSQSHHHHHHHHQHHQQQQQQQQQPQHQQAHQAHLNHQLQQHQRPQQPVHPQQQQQQQQQQQRHSPVMSQHNHQSIQQLSPHLQHQQPPPPSPQPPQQQQQQQQQNHHHLDQHLGSSLDKIDTAELIRDIAFNSNMDMNLCSGLSLHLNGGPSSSTSNAHNHLNLQLDQQQSGSKCTNTNDINNTDKDC